MVWLLFPFVVTWRTPSPGMGGGIALGPQKQYISLIRGPFVHPSDFVNVNLVGAVGLTFA